MTEPSASARIFISVGLPVKVRDELRNLQRELALVGDHIVYWTPPEQMHLTLRFLGDVAVDALAEVEAALHRACAGTPPFELRAAGLGGFPDLLKPHTLWAGVVDKDGALRSLEGKIQREMTLGNGTETHDFSPHITIGRVKTGSQRFADAAFRELTDRIKMLIAPDFGTWQVGEVLIMKSKLSSAGAQHEQFTAVKLSA